MVKIKLKIVIISGTPAVGKTTVATLLKDLIGGIVISLTNFVLENDLFDTWDDERETRIIDEDKVRGVAQIPEEFRPQVIVTLGYPDEKVPMPSKYPIEILTYFNGWRNRMEDVSAFLGYHSVQVAKAVGKGKAQLQKTIEKAAEKGKKIIGRLKSSRR